jgi:hypothetical protein
LPGRDGKYGSDLLLTPELASAVGNVKPAALFAREYPRPWTDFGSIGYRCGFWENS